MICELLFTAKFPKGKDFSHQHPHSPLSFADKFQECEFASVSMGFI